MALNLAAEIFEAISGGASNPQVIAGIADPSAGGGVAAPEGTLYLRFVATAGEIWYKTGAAAVAWAHVTPGDTAGWYGDGTDGDVTIAAGGAALTRDMFYNNLTNNATLPNVLDPAGFRIHVRGTLTNNGTIRRNGNAAVGAAAGAQIQVGSLWFLAYAGGAGGVGVGGAGSANVAVGFGGDGGAGGAGSVGAAGAGGNNGVQGFSGHLRAEPFLSIAHQISNNVFLPIAGGAGGGGGGGDGANSGGGGGGGADGVVIAARNIVNSSIIESLGGDGANGVAGNSGGGGGGGGGVVLLNYDSYTGNVPVVTGGAKGTGVGTGADGNDGDPGLIIDLQNTE